MKHTLLMALAALAIHAVHGADGEKHRALLASYCFDCHDKDSQKGKFRMDDLTADIRAAGISPSTSPTWKASPPQ